MKILVADDDATSRVILKEALRKRGHEIVQAVNGAEAWEQMQAPAAPRLAILDWMMPELQGPEVVRRIRSRETSDPPYLIILTTRRDKSDLVAGLNGGANDYLSKPFDLGELQARVEVGQRMLELQTQLAEQVAELRSALEHIKTLEGILPICSYCREVRDDAGYWRQLEAYIAQHSDTRFSHGICPECLEKQLALLHQSK